MPSVCPVQKRNVSHAVAQVSRAARVLPPQAVLSLAVGNEPDAYATGQEPTHVRLRSVQERLQLLVVPQWQLRNDVLAAHATPVFLLF